MTVDNGLPLNVTLITDAGMDFPYCKTAAQGKQVRRGFEYGSQRLEDKVRGG